MKVCLHLSSPNLIENDHNFVFFDYKMWTQQHFESRLFKKKCRKAENLRITDAVCPRLNVAWDNGPRYASTKKMPNKGTFRELLKWNSYSQPTKTMGRHGWMKLSKIMIRRFFKCRIIASIHKWRKRRGRAGFFQNLL